MENKKKALMLDLGISADSRYRFDRKKIRRSVLNLLSEHHIKQKVELSLSLVGERKIRELEQKYFGVNKLTDVLSFPQMEGKPIPSQEDVLVLGDVIVCYPQAKRQALRFNRLIDDEIEFLVNHGVLHLLGVHHD